MLPQTGQHAQRPQQQHPQPGLPSFMAPANPVFDPPPNFNLDPSQAAKQMAALNAASQARIAANTRAPPVSLSTNAGTSSAPYIGGITTSATQSGLNHDLLTSSANGHVNFQVPNNHGVPPMPNSAVNTTFLESPMSQTNAARNMSSAGSPVKQRQQGFLYGLHSIMAKRNTPLPPALTGINSPNYDPSNSPWTLIEPGTEIGSFKLAGKDIDLFKLWGLVFQSGGGQALTTTNGWNAILSHFDLPDEFPQVQANGSTSVATMVSQYYMAILYPFEEMYRKNIQEQHKKASVATRPTPMMHNMQMASGLVGQGQPQHGMSNSVLPMQRASMAPLNQSISGSHGMAASTNGVSRFPPPSQPPHHRPQAPVVSGHQLGSVNTHNSGSVLESILPSTHASDVNLLDQDMQGIKRKLDVNDLENKRVRQKMDLSDGNPIALGSSLDNHPPESSPIAQQPASSLTSVRPHQQPSRRKIEYIPLAREVDSFGGRDLKVIESDLASMAQRRPLRDINDWGTVDVEALTMSIRSRLSTELSYALTTFTLLSTMRGQTPGSGFPIFQCLDLLDEVLDFLEDQAFGNPDALPDFLSDQAEVITNRQLVNAILEEQSLPFSALEPHQGSKDPDIGPLQRPGNYVLSVVNIIRNLSIIPDNVEFIARHERLVDIMLRLCTIVQQGGIPTPASPHLSLYDVVSIRKDTLYTLSTIAGFINLSTSSHPSKTTSRIAQRAFELVASYLVDSSEATSPLSCVQQAGVPLGGNLKPPLLADMALEVLARLSQTDYNRQVLTKAIPQASLWNVLQSLVHRLPVLDADFQLMTRETWLSYLEKIVMAIYSLVFMASQELKQRIRTDRTLGFKAVMVRLIHRFMTNSHEGRTWFFVCARRATETLKVLDDAIDPLDNSGDSATPTLSFGMGFADSGDSGIEKGTGLLGGHTGVAWDVLMLREVNGDEVMFNELESLVRVECQ